RNFILRLQMLQGLRGSFGQRLQYGTNTVGQIEQDNHGKRQLILAEGGDLLLDTIFEDLKILTLQRGCNAPCLLVDHLGVNNFYMNGNPIASSFGHSLSPRRGSHCDMKKEKGEDRGSHKPAC